MAIIQNNSYHPKYLFRNKHFNTIYRTVFSQHPIDYVRKRIDTQDHDFLDLDFSMVHSEKIALVIHGLEGSSNSNYVKSLTRVLNGNNFDVVAMNLRGCSGLPNRLPCSYHSGKTDDLNEVFSYIESQYNYKEINIIGFSLGGNIILKYLGEKKYKIPALLNSAVTISVPCDLKGSALQLAKTENYIYMRRFLKSLKIKSLNKFDQFDLDPAIVDKIRKAKNFYDFDNGFTAPIHGFIDAEDYWRKCSSKQYLSNITTSTLLISSIDDPFLSASCIPREEAKNNDFFNLELSEYGGHVGFNKSFKKHNNLWLEQRILQFILCQQ